MKKTYTSIKWFIVLLSLVAVNMNAQLAGVYTINSASPTAGSNYQTFNAFKTALVASGINGPVTVNVVANSGPYVEQVDFPQIVGSSAANTITINGNGCTITFQGTSASPWTFDLSGMDYMYVNNLNMYGTDGTYALVCHLWNSSSNNRFDNCTFNAPQGGTSSAQVPFSISGSGTSPTSSGNSGDNNVANACTMNWGYYGITMYGLSASPYNVNNQIIGCTVNDFYVYGCYNVYQRQLVYRGNTLQRLNRTTLTTTYGILCTTGTYQSLIENNRIQKLFESAPGTSATAYLLYMSASSALGFESIIRNNVVSVDKMIGSAYCIYNPSYQYNNYYHNTISVDSQTDNGSLNVYGFYFYGINSFVKNNNISITRAGTGSRYGLYFASTVSAGCSNGNNIWVNGASTTNYVGYNSATATSALTLATWSTATGFDANSFTTDPFFLNPSQQNFMPSSYVMNNGGLALGVTTDILGGARSATTPDPGAYEYFNTPCAGSPAANTVITPTALVCPNSPINAYLANSYTTSGNTYQWQTSTVSPVGPFTAVSGGTNAALNATVGSSVIYYSAIITCTNGNNSATAVSGSVNVAGTTTNSVPYFEGFEGIASAGKLPNCSWTSNSLNGNCFTYNTTQNQNRIPYQGSKFASFYYSPAGNYNFFSNGIQLNAGVTYSIAVWYTTEYYGYNTWDLKLWLGPNQSTVGANIVATTGGVAASPSYNSLSNTFSVATSGLYYVGVNGISNGACCGYYMSWDNLAITLPCQLNPFAVTVNSNAQSICAGQSVNLTANGAGSYLWNTGATTNVITVSPSVPTTYTVVGTNGASGCTVATTKFINVNPVPPVGIYAPNTSVCLGSSVVLSAYGANTYTWSNNTNNNALSVSPTTSSSYTVLGTNSFGCTSQAVQAIGVNPLPNVQILSSNASDLACVTDITTLTGSGAATYQWLSNNGTISGNPINVSPSSTITYTLVGTSAQGCVNTMVYELNVTNCVGLNNLTSTSKEVKLYPNPSNGDFTVEWKNGFTKKAEITDISGRVIFTATSGSDVMNVSLNAFSNGVYFVKVQSNGSTEVIRIVKQ